MADKIENKIEREYTIPLRKEWSKVSNYRRTGRAIKEIKKFIARHMKVPDRDTDKVKLDIYLNNEVWFRGRKKPPAKIKVKAVKEGDIVKVSLLEMPPILKFRKARHEKMSVPSKKEEIKKEEKENVKTEEEEKEEKEKEISVAEQRSSEAKQKAREKKHTIKSKEQVIHRMSLQK